jgi:hypothetical protein
MTLDPDFQRERQIAKIRNPPGNALEGFAIGARHFLADCKSGLFGVVVRIEIEALPRNLSLVLCPFKECFDGSSLACMCRAHRHIELPP